MPILPFENVRRTDAPNPATVQGGSRPAAWLTATQPHLWVAIAQEIPTDAGERMRRAMTTRLATALTAMEGGGFYNRNSGLQAAGMSLALPLLAHAAEAVPTPESAPLVIVDYGASQGRNSLAPMGLAIETLRRRVGPDRPIEVIHEDLPGNDFASLFTTLAEDPASYLGDDPNVFASAVGRSYYEPVTPPSRVLLGWNAWTLHWMSRNPVLVADHAYAVFSREAGAREAVRRQQADDWRRFLAARARELQAGGRIVCLMAGRAESDGGEWIIGEFWQAVLSMGRDGLLSADERARITFPSAGRSAADLRAPFEEGPFDGLALEHVSGVETPDPFFDAYAASGDVAGLARAWSGMAQAVGRPVLATALAGRPDTALVTDELFRRFEARVAAAPRRLSDVAARAVIRKL